MNSENTGLLILFGFGMIFGSSFTFVTMAWVGLI